MILTVILNFLQVLAGGIQSSHSQLHRMQDVINIRDALSARGIRGEVEGYE
jgi:hypothetical protein